MSRVAFQVSCIEEHLRKARGGQDATEIGLSLCVLAFGDLTHLMIFAVRRRDPR